MNDLESRDQIIADLSARLDMTIEAAESECERLRSEVERIKNQISLAAYDLVTEPVMLPPDHTWEQERAAVVAYLLNWLAEDFGVAFEIERGEHWPTEGGTP